MENGVSHGAKATTTPRAAARDAAEAVRSTEGAIVQWLDAAATPERAGREEPENAFGERVLRPEARAADPGTRVRQAAERAAQGARVGLIASTGELLAARDALAEVAAQRLGTVFHAVEPQGAEAALALAEIGWAILFASDVEESVDLALVARRAAEDSGTPFLVVHDVAAVRRIEPLLPLDPAFVTAFLGPADLRVRRTTDPAHPSHARVNARTFAERVPFALASAFRELEALTGRKRDLLTRSAPGQGAEAPLVLVGLGALGDVLLGEVPRLRAAGHDVGALKVTAYRPFAGPRTVRLLARALAVTVLEHVDTPLAQSNALTRELKAAFADALTWAPEYPGVGRIPRVHSGVLVRAAHDVEASDLDAVVRNMLAGEQGKRFFLLGGDSSLELPRGAARAPAREASAFHLRGLVRDPAAAAHVAELLTVVLARVLALSVRASVRPLPAAEGTGYACDLTAGSARPQGVHVRADLALLVIEDAASLLDGNPLARLGSGATVAVPMRRASPEVVWDDLPPYAKAIVFDRGASVTGWEPAAPGTAEEAPWLLAGAFAGVALAALALPVAERPRVDASLVEREVAEAVRERSGLASEGLGARAGQVARRAFESSVAVPRSVLENDADAIRLGRQDARSTTA